MVVVSTHVNIWKYRTCPLRQPQSHWHDLSRAAPHAKHGHYKNQNLRSCALQHHSETNDPYAFTGETGTPIAVTAGVPCAVLEALSSQQLISAKAHKQR